MPNIDGMVPLFLGVKTVTAEIRAWARRLPLKAYRISLVKSGSNQWYSPDELPAKGWCLLRAVLFDLYSTLIHERPDNPFYTAIASSLGLDERRWRKQYSALVYESMIGNLPTMAARVFRACHQSGQPRDEGWVQSVVDEQMKLFYASLYIDPQTMPMLDELRQSGIRSAIVSNSSSYSELVLDDLGLRAAVSHVVMSYRVGVLKPEPRIYLTALEALNVPSNNATFVGDGGDNELLGARRVGLRTILIDRGLAHTENARKHADVVCSGLLEAGVCVITKPNVTSYD
jgi:putative hydrolase of the HAD superfamily